MNKAYCEQCKEDVEYIVVNERMADRYGYIDIPFLGKEAKCLNCKTLIYVRKITEQNLEIANYKYREILNIITISEIKEFLTSKNITSEELSEKLEWNKFTINEYLKGILPSKEYSEILRAYIKEDGIKNENKR